ncbi:MULTISPECIES: IS30 family transposase [unclassified Nocardioides]|uniref:IS30 family transposase n=1 Tax=Nocardioides sp. (strain ATCC BAA-499 / JS614) TaxID=196162 RepID=UPI0003260726
MIRRPPGVRLPDGRGGRPGILTVYERPAKVEDRAVPGHFEGDLVFGMKHEPGRHAGRAVDSIPDAWSRCPMATTRPTRWPTHLTPRIATLPRHLARSLTRDQGHEMAAPRRFTDTTGIRVHFCDAKSPWQRGSNENTNDLLRQYRPRRLDFRIFTQADFDAIAQELNERPRQTLEFKTPSPALAELLP